MTSDLRVASAGAWILSATPRAIAVDLLAGAIFRLVAEGRVPASRARRGHSAEAIP
jgi:hypothetical protein